MVQIVNRPPTAGQLLGQGLGEGFSQTLTQRLQEKQSSQKRQNALDLLDADGTFMDLPFMEQQKRLFASGLDPKDAQQISQNLQLHQKYEMEGKAKEAAAAKAAKVEERAASKEAREQEKFELEKAKPAKSGAQSVREKKMDEKAIAYYDDIVRGQDKAKRSENTIDRLWELSGKTEGLWGYVQATFGSEAVSELRALGLSATDAVIAALFPNRVTDAKFKAVQEKFALSPWDSSRTQRGKLRALKTFSNEVAARGKRMDALIEEYGGNIDNVPSSKILELQRQGETFDLDEIDAKSDWIIEQSAKSVEQEDLQQPPTQEPPQQQVAPVPIAPQPVETPSKREKTPSSEPKTPSKKEEAPEKKRQLLPPQPSPQGGVPTRQAAKPKAPPDEGSLIPKEGSARLKRRLGALEKVRQTMDPKKFDVLFADEIIDAYSEEGITRGYGITGRAAAKGIGGLADFGSFLARLVTGSGAPIEEFTEKNFGKKMGFTELAEKSYDLLTSDEFVPKGAVERTYEKGVQMGTEFASPAAMMKSAKAGTLFLEGATAGTLSNTAKEAGLGAVAQTIPYFLSPLAAISKKGATLAREVATNPAVMKEWWKGIKNWMSEAKESVKEAAKTPFARVAVKKFGLDEASIKADRIAQLQKRGMKRSPLSEVFESEPIYELEAKIASQPEAAEIYKPLLEELNTERLEKYGEFIASTAAQKGQEILGQVSHPSGRQEIKNVFEHLATGERSRLAKEVGLGYDVLHTLRNSKDRASWKDTKYILDGIERSREKIKMGGIGPNDEAVLKYLDSLEKRILKKSPQAQKRINELESEIEAMGFIKPGSPGHTKNVKPREKELAGLMQQGASIEEIEAAHRVINAGMNWDKALKFPQHMKIEAKKNIERAITNYGTTGKRGKKYSDMFFKTKAKYKDAKETVMSDMLWNVRLGQKPELVMSLLDKPDGVRWFKKNIMTSVDLQTSAAGRELITSKVHEILSSKVLNAEGQVRGKVGKLSIREQDLLESLIGKRGYNNFVQLSESLGENQKKVNSYINASKTHSRARSDTKALAQASGFWNVARGFARVFTGKAGKGLTDIATGTAKIAGSHVDRVTAMLLTDHSVQEAMIKVIKESKKAKPSIGPMNKFAAVIKKRLEKSGKTASLSDVLGIEEGLYPEDK
jgi:hypothetical protein